MNTLATRLTAEQELENKMFGTPEAKVTTEVKAPVESEETKVAPVEPAAVTAPLDKPIEDAEEIQEREEDWKLRYTNLRNSRDTKLYDAQTALATVTQQVSLLQQQVQDLMTREPVVAPDVFKDAFTEEEREALGETAIAAMQKTANLAANAQTEKINEELKQARANAVEAAKLQASNAAQSAYETFLGKLGNVVPDFAQVDVDPGFKAFMATPDIDGSPRSTSFAVAEANGDAATVAKHFLDYKATKNPKAEAKASLEAKVAPTGDASAVSTTTATGADAITMRDITAHYHKRNTGGYKGKQSEFLAMEARVDAAVSSGKIRG